MKTEKHVVEAKVKDKTATDLHKRTYYKPSCRYGKQKPFWSYMYINFRWKKTKGHTTIKIRNKYVDLIVQANKINRQCEKDSICANVTYILTQDGDSNSFILDIAVNVTAIVKRL